MSVYVLSIFLNELEKIDKMRGLPIILSLFRNEINKINNTRARILHSIYHMTLSIGYGSYITIIKELCGNERSE